MRGCQHDNHLLGSFCLSDMDLEKRMQFAVIGGGAAGFFAAIAAKENYPTAEVVIFEKSLKVLAKVKVSGGGRCNVTNACFSISELCKAYPRGGKKLKKAFEVFNVKHTMAWFESRGVPLVVEENNHVFPASNSSQTIIDCLVQEARRLGIVIESVKGVKTISSLQNAWQLSFLQEEQPARHFDKVIIATGGSPQRRGLEWLEELGHKIEDPVPSLFTFNMPGEKVVQLMGVSVENAIASIQGTKLKSEGPLLITHWGMSGPAVLKLSAFGARELAAADYQCKLQVNWVGETNNEVVADQLNTISQEHPNKLLSNCRPYALPDRLWLFLLEKSELPQNKKWGELGKKGMNKLVSLLTNDIYSVQGKTTFKEEFVTCGGVSLDDVDMNTMESKVCKGLYFAGEIMDVDAITGGYNFQAAWTTGFIAGRLR